MVRFHFLAQFTILLIFNLNIMKTIIINCLYELNRQKYLLVYCIIFSNKSKKIMKKYTWWTKPNPEGVSNKDVFQVILFGICLLGFLIGMWFIITSL